MIFTCDPLGFPLLQRHCFLPAKVLLCSMERLRLSGDQIYIFLHLCACSYCPLAGLISSSFQLPWCHQPRSTVGPLAECWCSHQHCLLECFGTPNLASVGAPGNCEPGFPSSLPSSILSSPVQFPWMQPVDLGLPRCCQPTWFPCCSTLEVL